MPVTDDFIVHTVLDSLLLEYEQLTFLYSPRDKWSIDKLSIVCVQYENVFNKKRTKKAHFNYYCQVKSSNGKKFKFCKKNNQGNGLNSSNSWNEKNKSSKK